MDDTDDFLESLGDDPRHSVCWFKNCINQSHPDYRFAWETNEDNVALEYSIHLCESCLSNVCRMWVDASAGNRLRSMLKWTPICVEIHRWPRGFVKDTTGRGSIKP